MYGSRCDGRGQSRHHHPHSHHQLTVISCWVSQLKQRRVSQRLSVCSPTQSTLLSIARQKVSKVTIMNSVSNFQWLFYSDIVRTPTVTTANKSSTIIFHTEAFAESFFSPGHYDDDHHGHDHRHKNQPSGDDDETYSNTLDLMDPIEDESVSKRAERMLKKVNRYGIWSWPSSKGGDNGTRILTIDQLHTLIFSWQMANDFGGRWWACAQCLLYTILYELQN